MSLAKITLYGMYQWMQNSQDDLFSQLNLPTGMESSDLINTIMMHGAEFEVLYANPQYMQSMIGIWSNKWYHTFERWIKALAIDYDPLENYDRREEWSDAGSKNRTGDGNDVAYRHNSSQASEDTNTQAANSTFSKSEHDSTNEHTVSAYDSSAYQPESRDELKDDDTTTNGSSATSSIGKKSNTDESTESDSRAHTDREREATAAVHSGRIHGNIGTLTSQAMLQSEFDVARFNLYEEAANLFLTELTIYVY